MKCVLIFLMLSLVVFMVDPCEGFLGSLWRGTKAIFSGARKSMSRNRRTSKSHKMNRKVNQDIVFNSAHLKISLPWIYLHFA
uniref:Uncharacterized protein n=1 Tax=Cyprinodon variegatus TaxID=28743 RepID=A0A3Q2EI78_CYPVA